MSLQLTEMKALFSFVPFKQFFQLMCDANLVFINCIAKWPGSVQDARILREFSLSDDFESNQRKPAVDSFWETVDVCCVTGCSLHSQTLLPVGKGTATFNTVQRVQRWKGPLEYEREDGTVFAVFDQNSLRPVVAVCVMLHNRATPLNLDVPSDSESDNNPDSEPPSSKD